MRGQATPIQPADQKILKGSNNRHGRKDRLPSYLQSLHHIRPARPSMGSLGLGSDALNNLSIAQNTWKPPDISSLHNVAEQAAFHRNDAKRFFFKDKVLSIASAPKIGGAERDRTADPLLAKQVLSQLSYSPNCLRSRAKPCAGAPDDR